MKAWRSALALVAAVTTATPCAAFDFQLVAGAAGSINVTPDSARGWIPTPQQRQGALDTTKIFLTALDDGRYSVAYAMLADGNKRVLPSAQFVQSEEKFRALAGSAKVWKVVKVTWTKDPAQAPMPGIYVAIDLAAQFANIDRDCGYIVLYQPAPGSSFILMRRENNYLDNATARGIEQKQSKAEVDRMWVQLSRSCPNY